MNDNWIDWKTHPVPRDIRGLIFKYQDGSIFSDRYNPDKTRKFYLDQEPIAWQFMERSDSTKKSVLAINHPEC
jgi:hypothetical protein